MNVDPVYLGDGVYAAFDGYHVVLSLPMQSPNPDNAIYLEPEVLAALDEYRTRIMAALTKTEPPR